METSRSVSLPALMWKLLPRSAAVACSRCMASSRAGVSNPPGAPGQIRMMGLLAGWIPPGA